MGQLTVGHYHRAPVLQRKSQTNKLHLRYGTMIQ